MTRECITRPIVFETQNTNCPIEVVAEVKQLWRDYEAGNDFYYIPFDASDDSDLQDDYPIVYKYLRSRGVTDMNVLIHWWW